MTVTLDRYLAIVYHSYVFVHPHNVIDYRTDSSGIRATDLTGEQVKAVIKDKIIIGHALFNDLAALSHRHVYEDVRDTALFYPLRKLTNIVHEGQYPSLRALSKEVLGREIQTGEHSPIEDARATMDVFLAVREEYETGLAQGHDVVACVPTSMAKWYW
ncbi:uncharacterized protein EHS24_005764 [Apiotrichum porosum]|uniref:Exonuclease domain-containing protein n=1 Tax=Apiotrichum porosum TaxID=105984 RepID=A0A427XZL0_9TREE|nr:uncharacterized protein EHS24_005764 [Apiotrichum porosum]RSH84252.1 hypothetical protein EHS24_005764 [Apiotrichum porosum]